MKNVIKFPSGEIMRAKNKIEYPDEKENAYISTGYVQLLSAPEVMQKIKKEKRAPLPSPLLQEHMRKEAGRK